MGDDRAPVYYEGSKLVIRASAMGHPCMWELIAAGQGVDSSGAPAFMKRAFQEGHDAEPLIVKWLEDFHGVVFRTAQEQGELILSGNLLNPEVVMRYHPDGIGELGKLFLQYLKVIDSTLARTSYPWGELAVVEIKNLSDGLWQQAVKGGVESTIADYPWQLSGMMIDQQLPGLWVCRNKGKKVKGVKVYCKDEGKYYFQWVPRPLVPLSEFIKKARAIKQGVDGEDLLTSDRPCDDPDHFPCLYRHVRPEPEEDVMGSRKKDKVVYEVPEADEKELEEEIAQMLSFKGQMDEAKDAYERHRDNLMAKLPDGIDVVRTSKREFNVRPSYSSGINWDDMPRELRDQIEAFKRSEVTGRHVRDFKRLD